MNDKFSWPFEEELRVSAQSGCKNDYGLAEAFLAPVN